MITTATHISDEESETSPATNPETSPEASLASLTLTLTHEQTTALVDALCDADKRLATIALEFNTTVEALSLFTMRPDIAARLDAVMNVFSRRVRLYAANVLPAAVNALHETIRSFHWEETKVMLDRHNLKQLEQR